MNHYRDRHETVALLEDPDNRRRINDLAARMHLPPPTVEKRICTRLDGLVTDQRTWARRLLTPLERLVYAAPVPAVITKRELSALREINGGESLIFLPAHRSYADSHLLSRALRKLELPATFRFAGDNLSFWPFSWLARHCGVIFIRRSFGSDRLYRFAVRAYLARLLERGVHLEWYVEGGRSRTGRLRTPRIGLVCELLKALDETGRGDVHIVPVSITYDLLPEAAWLVAEDGGAGKPAENLRSLVRYLRTNRRVGRTAYLGFGTPFPIQRADARPGAGKDARPGDRSHRKTARAVAERLTEQLHVATPVTAESLIALVLAAGEGRPHGVPAIARALVPLLGFMERRGIPAIGTDRLKGGPRLRKSLDRMVRAGIVSSVRRGGEPCYQIGRHQRHLASYYLQSGGHWFVPRAVAELSLMMAAGALPQPEDRVLAAARRLHGLLGHAFVLPPWPRFADQVWRETAELTAATQGDAEHALAEQPFLLAHRLLGAAVEATHTVAVRLTMLPTDRPAEREGLLRIDADASHTAQWPESVSKELLRAAAAAATAEGLLAAGAHQTDARRRFEEEVAGLLGRLRRIAAHDAASSPSLPKENP
ncbi:1-acyl-sn-glycerol-3-phosphate acyltransferase [Actinomadura rubrisoli]|uniref:Phospholipid/glycerol acyltransferase domain-containing protein n=1 Tax=Actinomadura rubrisoli TaxID=2530368 RepID=A0A4R5CIK1_9ACTN|nr:1-acyl-sn-glycerol-3-phosphate acyltransferase [Actinomadura rubrisoli]TDD98143.1 hypothetical protein E1298_00300 [Actinomadura rubrisoli]